MQVSVGHFHDAELERVNWSRRQKTLELGFWNYDNSVSTINFMDVDEYRIIEMRSQSVVSQIWTSTLVASEQHGLDDDAIRYWVEWIYAGTFPLKPDARDKIVERVVKRDLSLLTMERSIGAEFAVLAKSHTQACDCGKRLEHEDHIEREAALQK